MHTKRALDRTEPVWAVLIMWNTTGPGSLAWINTCHLKAQALRRRHDDVMRYARHRELVG